MRKNFTREPANPRERFAPSTRLPVASVSCAISYAALGEATTVPELVPGTCRSVTNRVDFESWTLRSENLPSCGQTMIEPLVWFFIKKSRFNDRSKDQIMGSHENHRSY